MKYNTRTPRFDSLADLHCAVGRAHTDYNYAPEAEIDIACIVRAWANEQHALRRHVSLEEIVSACDRYKSSQVVIDAVIEVSLRSFELSRVSRREAIETLCDNYPEYRESILESAYLDELMGEPQPQREPLRRLSGGDLFGASTREGAERYKIVRLIGSGFHGDVYCAEDTKLSSKGHDALVALKVIRAVFDAGQNAKHSGMREAIRARRVRHTNVVSILDADVDRDGHVYLVFEHVAGGTLSDELSKSRNRTSHDVAAMMLQIASGCRVIHDAGLVHNDLKASNILIDRGGCIKVADLGTARIVGEASQDCEFMYALDGNWATMAPERRAIAFNCTSHLADIYSIGKILETVLENTDLSKGSTAAWNELAAIARKCSDVSPVNRYASAAHLSEELERCIRRLPLACVPTSPLRRARLLFQRHRHLYWTAPITAMLAVSAAFAVISSYQARTARRAVERVFGAVRVADKDFLARGFDWQRDGLFVLWALDAAHKGNIFPDHDFAKFSAAQRVRIAEQYLERAGVEGELDDPQSIVWQLVLCTWKLNDPAPSPEVTRMLADLRVRCGSLTPERPTMRTIALLERCNEVKAAKSSEEELPHDVRQHIAGLKVALLKDLDWATARSYGSPEHRLVLRCIEHVCSSSFADDHKLASEMNAEYKQLLDTR